MYFTQYIAPSILLAGSAVASNSKRSYNAYDSADSNSYDASYDSADKSGDGYVAPAAPAEYGDDYSWSSTGYDSYDYDMKTDWVSEAVAAVPTGDMYDTYDYDYSDKKETTWVNNADAAEPTGTWTDDGCDDSPVVEECDDDAAGESMVQVIKVSDKDGNLVFSPNDIKAPVGSYVQFHFWPKVCLLFVLDA